VTISIEEVRRLLTQPLSDSTRTVLKEWRAQTGYSQVEAAVRLGVPVRTLQGWELGRRMPYPALLQRAVSVRGRLADQYSMVQSDFPREFAEFIDFVGAQSLDKEIRKIEKRLGALSPGARTLYGDRYFFQEQCVRFTEDIPAFGLNLSDATAVRTASLVGGINRVRRSLSPAGISRFRSTVIDNLKRDMRQLEHEIRCAAHFSQKGLKVIFADLEGLGNFDLLVGPSTDPVEVECKTITQDTGSQLKPELVVGIMDSFVKVVTRTAPVCGSGIFTLTLNKAADRCKNLNHQLQQALGSVAASPVEADDFSFTFSKRPEWQQLLDAGHWAELNRQIQTGPDKEYSRGITNIAGKILALDIHPHAPSAFRKRVVGTLKNAADQCSGKRPGVVWLHFVGLPDQDFLALCEFSTSGSGTGLNGAVADALHPNLSTTDRCHIQSVRFSSDSDQLTGRPILDSNLLLGRAVSRSGRCYEVPNPRCRFPIRFDL
jgi:transcriptional regulator with XRE-family HTH domain